MKKGETMYIKQRGSSLLEILITLIVLGIGLTSLAVFQSSVSSSNSLAEQRTEASHLAQQKIEQLQDLRGKDEYRALAASNGSHVVGSGRNTEYSLSWTVNNSTGAEEYRALSVKVRWKDKHGDDQEVNLSTIVGDGNHNDLQVAALNNPARCADDSNDDPIDDDGDGFNDDDDGAEDDGNDDAVGDDGVDDDDDGAEDDSVNDDDDGMNDDGNDDGNEDGNDDGVDDDAACVSDDDSSNDDGNDKHNNGHGNNEDHVDSSNPGHSKEGKDSDSSVDDEKKKK